MHNPNKPLNELLSHSMVDIYVGPENTHWILHEKLLCTRSQFFNRIFYKKPSKTTQTYTSTNKTFGLPDEDNEPFNLFVGWLYSGRVPAPEEEKDLGNLFDLYLMAEKWTVADLVSEVLDTVRAWYRTTQTYPGLRRVQYVYANTDEDSPMRQLLVGSVARMMALADDMPKHWEKALRKNGRLAVDIMRAMQSWGLDEELVPDARSEMMALEKEKVEVVVKQEEAQEGVAKQMPNGDLPNGYANGEMVNGHS